MTFFYKLCNTLIFNKCFTKDINILTKAFQPAVKRLNASFPPSLTKGFKHKTLINLIIRKTQYFNFKGCIKREHCLSFILTTALSKYPHSFP